MYTNIGGKIKGLAKLICWIGIALSAISGIALLASSAILTGLLTIVVGALGSWVGSFVLYGFGELVENSGKLR